MQDNAYSVPCLAITNNSAMMNKNEIRNLLKSRDVNKIWTEVQKELPHLAFCFHLSEERTEACVDFLFDSISICCKILKQHDLSCFRTDDLIKMQSDNHKSFFDFCCKTLLYKDKSEFDINDLPYTLKELDMTEDELKQLYENADYDCSYIVSELIEFYIITNHQSLLMEYYKGQGLTDYEKQAIDMLNIYSSLK